MTATPALVTLTGFHTLDRIALSADRTGKDGVYTERWLQELIQRCPGVLPIEEIEPGFGDLIPVSCEVACAHGHIDNLFVTAEGGVAIVETKLWRNQESRRRVVAQVLDYAAALSKMDYESFERAALAGEFLASGPRPNSLYEMVAQAAEATDEATFRDALSRNLKRGRLLLIAAGDGIRTETEALAEYLQLHAGARFTFALVAIELFRTAQEGEVLAVPRTLAKTVLIERGVVSVEEGRVEIRSPSPSQGAAIGVKATMTEEMFMEAMGARTHSLPAALRAFLADLSRIGVEPDWRQSLNLKWRGGPDGPVNVGYIGRNGPVWTEVVSKRVPDAVARRYLAEIAAIVSGSVKDSGMGPYVVGADGKSPPLVEELLPAHAAQWLAAVQRLIEGVQALQQE